MPRQRLALSNPCHAVLESMRATQDANEHDRGANAERTFLARALVQHHLIASPEAVLASSEALPDALVQS